MQRYELAIQRLVDAAPEIDKFVHMFAGLAVWLVSAILLRRPLRSRAPMLILVLIELANEWIDYLAGRSLGWGETLADMAATWFWPAVLTSAFGLAPWLVAERKER